jgi:hypothetical protein
MSGVVRLGFASQETAKELPFSGFPSRIMTLREFEEILEEAQESSERFSKMVDVLGLLKADLDFFAYAHHSFLPAAKEYREYLRSGEPRSSSLKKFRRLRGRLGGVSAQLYRHQKKTFERLILLWVPGEVATLVSPLVTERLWRKFKEAERKWLHQHRKLRG